jgi:hypothetical protein
VREFADFPRRMESSDSAGAQLLIIVITCSLPTTRTMSVVCRGFPYAELSHTHFVDTRRPAGAQHGRFSPRPTSDEGLVAEQVLGGAHPFQGVLHVRAAQVPAPSQQGRRVWY